MTRWLYGVAIVASGYFTWCYFVPAPADRIQQTSEACYRLVAGIGGMLHAPMPELGDVISGARDSARATCASMLYGFTQGAADLARRENLERQAQNPALYAPGASAANASAWDPTGLPGSATTPDSQPAADVKHAASAPSSSAHTADQAGRAVDGNLPNAGNPDSL
ncbi:hypothetical protein [Burkholderia gladioli]|uniref:hypothetical protein n=1 Tax=Burkholderia gladioli TaxID=28095 RepID=UPI000FDB9C9A|nr:hypothetical protein [Burkholderia gladioli]